MNKLIFVPLALALLCVVVSATPANTIFVRQGIPYGTSWRVYISTAYNQSFNISLTSTGNYISTNAPLTSSASYLYVAGYNLAGVYTYTHGNVNIGSNNIVNFTPQANTIAPSYSPCSHNQSLCAPVTGTLSLNTSTLQNKVLGPPYSANLTIYVNPAGYYEYVIQNESLGSNPKTQLSQSIYVNILPGQIFNQSLNLSFIGHQLTLFKLNESNTITTTDYQGAIFYSDLIDISPLEYDMLGGNLTPQTFSNFVYQNAGSFYNTTLVYNTNEYKTKSSIGAGILSGIGQAITLALNQLVSLSTFELVQSGKVVQLVGSLTTVEITTLPTQSIPIMLENIPNSTVSFPMFVSYAYPNTLCQLNEPASSSGICVQSGQKGMLAFNNYIDNTYAPQILMNIFLTADATCILGFAIVILIVKKINGE